MEEVGRGGGEGGSMAVGVDGPMSGGGGRCAGGYAGAGYGLTLPGGGGAEWQPGPTTHPHQKIFPQGKK